MGPRTQCQGAEPVSRCGRNRRSRRSRTSTARRCLVVVRLLNASAVSWSADQLAVAVDQMSRHGQGGGLVLCCGAARSFTCAGPV
jgi:hypothetical protein